MVVDIRKIRDYCLSAEHSRGGHKARVLRLRLGSMSNDAQLLRRALLGATTNQANKLLPTASDHHGQRFVLDFEMVAAGGTATVRSGWIILAGEQTLRFVTCYVMK